MGQPPLGCHVSISGGFHKAVQRGHDVGCECIQVFTTPPRIWPSPDPATSDAMVASRVKPIEAQDVDRFQTAMSELGMVASLAHASYMINLASPDPNLWLRSKNALYVELSRAATLGIEAVVFHPGAYTKSSPEQGMERIAEALNAIDRQLDDAEVICLLESTAGQGTNLGFRFEQLAEMLDRLETPARFGVCLDTCHLFAAGYPLADRNDYAATMGDLDKWIGIKRVRAIHLNDSQHPIGSRKDRHEHIGEGQMGLEPFRNLLADDRFRHVPMYLETPKGEHEGEEWDQINLRQLRSLINQK